MKIAVGQGSCGIAAGAGTVYNALKEKINKENITLSVTGCNGMCFLEPIVDMYYDGGEFARLVKVTDKDADIIVKSAETNDPSLVEELKISEEDNSFLTQQTRIALRHCGVIDPTSIDDYVSDDGYKAITKVLKEYTPEQVIEIIKTCFRNFSN